MNFKYLLVLSILSILLSACSDKGLGSALMDKKSCYRKHTAKVKNNDQEIEVSCPVGNNTSYPEKVKYAHPVFNPNNKYEIIYTRSAIEEGKPGQPELWKFNFCTGETKRIADVAVSGADWSTKDWLIYRSGGKQLKKIKSNGDSLVVLPKVKAQIFPPKWNEKGDLFALRIIDKKQKNHILVATESGASVGTSNDFILKKWDWVGKQICYVDAKDGMQAIKMFNFETRTSHTVETINNYSSSDSLFLTTIYFKEKEQIFWNQKKKICYTDLETKKRTTLLTGAGNRMYYHMSLSTDGTTIIASRVDIKKISACKMEERWSLVLIDVATGEERLVKLNTND